MKKSRFRKKIKEKLDLTKLKDKVEDLGIFKSKLDKLREKLDELEKDEPESTPLTIREINQDSIRQKYKSISLLGKTKQILQEYDALEDSYLPPDDLNELQEDLAQISSEIKEEDKKEIKWESLKTKHLDKKRSIRSGDLVSIKDYWISAFSKLFSLYSEENPLIQVSKIQHSHMKFKFPLLNRVLEKIQLFNNRKEEILFLL